MEIIYIKNLPEVFNTPFSKVEGVTDEGVKYRTLFLSKVYNLPLVDRILDKPCLFNPEAAFEVDFRPVLDELAGFANFLGTLSMPRLVDLAVTHLSVPVAMFMFVTVVDTAELRHELSVRQLEGLIQEGVVDTLTKNVTCGYCNGTGNALLG